MPRGFAWSVRLSVDRIAPAAALEEAVLMNSLLDTGGIRVSSCHVSPNTQPTSHTKKTLPGGNPTRTRPPTDVPERRLCLKPERSCRRGVPREYPQECPRLQHNGHTKLPDGLRPLNSLRDRVFHGKHHPR